MSRIAQEVYTQDVPAERWAAYPPLDPDWVNEKFKHFINNHRKGDIPGDGEGSPSDDYDLAPLKEFCGSIGLNYERVALLPARQQPGMRSTTSVNWSDIQSAPADDEPLITLRDKHKTLASNRKAKGQKKA